MDDWPPADIQMYYNPTLDFLSYFLINTLPPIATVFILGALHGLNLWLMFHLAYPFVSYYERKQAIGISLAIALVGFYGPISFSETGSFVGDNLISLFALTAILLQVYFLKNYIRLHSKPATVEFGKKSIFKKDFSWGLLLISGFVLGAGVGLKLVIAYCVVGSIAAFLFLPWPFTLRIKIIFLWGASVALGFFLSYGYWMLLLWQRYHNPFFPHFNGIFHSPDFTQTSWQETAFLPKTTFQSFFYPFYFSWNGSLVCERFFMDFRFAVAYLLFIFSSLMIVYRKVKENHGSPYFKKISFFYKNVVNPSFNLLSYWLLIFFIFSYITWQLYSASMRYLNTLQILTPLIIYLLLRFLMKETVYRLLLLAFVFYFLVVAMIPMSEAGLRLHTFGKTYFNIALPDFIRHDTTAMVLTIVPNLLFSEDMFKTTIISSVYYERGKMPSPASLSAVSHPYLIPSFPKNFHFVGITTIGKYYALTPHAKKWIQQFPGPFYLLTTQANMPSFLRLAAQFDLYPDGTCGSVSSDRLQLPHLRHSVVLLCRAVKK